MPPNIPISKPDAHRETFIGLDGRTFQGVRINADTVTDEWLRSAFGVKSMTSNQLRACIAENAEADDDMGARWVTVCQDQLTALKTAAAEPNPRTHHHLAGAIYHTDTTSNDELDHTTAQCDACGETQPVVIDTELGKRAAVCAECLRGWLARIEASKPEEPEPVRPIEWWQQRANELELELTRARHFSVGLPHDLQKLVVIAASDHVRICALPARDKWTRDGSRYRVTVGDFVAGGTCRFMTFVGAWRTAVEASDSQLDFVALNRAEQDDVARLSHRRHLWRKAD